MKAKYFSLPAGYAVVSRVGISTATEKIKTFWLGEEKKWNEEHRGHDGDNTVSHQFLVALWKHWVLFTATLRVSGMSLAQGSGICCWNGTVVIDNHI